MPAMAQKAMTPKAANVKGSCITLILSCRLKLNGSTSRMARMASSFFCKRCFAWVSLGKGAKLLEVCERFRPSRHYNVFGLCLKRGKSTLRPSMMTGRLCNNTGPRSPYFF